MALTTENMGLELLSPGQGSAHVSVNESLTILDAAVSGILFKSVYSETTITLSREEALHGIIVFQLSNQPFMVKIPNKPTTTTVLNTSSYAGTIVTETGAANSVQLISQTTAVLVCNGYGQLYLSGGGSGGAPEPANMFSIYEFTDQVATPSWTVPYTGWYRVACCGAGAAGGSVGKPTLNGINAGSGGGGGEYAYVTTQLVAGSVIPLTIGKGGLVTSAAPGTPGQSGGSTSFGSILYVAGGTGGYGSNSANTGIFSPRQGIGGASGLTTPLGVTRVVGADGMRGGFSVSSSQGSVGDLNLDMAQYIFAGRGGNSMIGLGGIAETIQLAGGSGWAYGVSGKLYGGGGGGGITRASQTEATDVWGGNGADGLIQVQRVG